MIVEGNIDGSIHYTDLPDAKLLQLHDNIWQDVLHSQNLKEYNQHMEFHDMVETELEKRGINIKED